MVTYLCDWRAAVALDLALAVSVSVSVLVSVFFFLLVPLKWRGQLPATTIQVDFVAFSAIFFGQKRLQSALGHTDKN